MTNIRQPIPLLNLLLHPQMLLILRIEVIRHTPLITGKHSPWLQHTIYLTVHPHAIRRMTRGLNRICRIICPISKGHVHEITLHRTATGGPELWIGVAQLIASIDLILVEGQSGHVCTGEFANVAHGATDAASYVEYLEFGCIRREGKFGGEVVFVAADGFSEGFVGVAVGEVEGLSPAPFVEEGGEVVVRVDEGFVFLVSLGGFGGGVEAIVFVNAAFHVS
mmetsp:Transcript_23090/g.34388  ORF Transcript_23090/g.34388 Transcript_23090/m.34388 type:complete len:222 (-) Transcript_23090:127-792(-)